MFHVAKFNDILGYFTLRRHFFLPIRRPVHADAVRHEQRAVGRAVDLDLQHVAQRAVAGCIVGVEVGEVDLGPFARGKLVRIGDRQQSALLLRAQVEAHLPPGGVDRADGRLHALSRI